MSPGITTPANLMLSMLILTEWGMISSMMGGIGGGGPDAGNTNNNAMKR